MALSLDGFDVFAAIAQNRDVFDGVRIAADKSARTLVKAQFTKLKKGDAASLNRLAHALGRENFDLFVDTMTDKEVTSAVGKFDPFNADAKAEAAAGQRNHFRALATGFASPTAKPVKVKAPPKPGASKPKKAEPDRIYSAAMRARKQRSPSDR